MRLLRSAKATSSRAPRPEVGEEQVPKSRDPATGYGFLDSHVRAFSAGRGSVHRPASRAVTVDLVMPTRVG